MYRKIEIQIHDILLRKIEKLKVLNDIDIDTHDLVERLFVSSIYKFEKSDPETIAFVKLDLDCIETFN